mgnify:CR=1 FL=1
MAGSNYEVNIKLNLKSVNKQLNNLEKRISRINKLAQGGRASRTVNKNEQEKLKSATKRFQIEERTLRVKKKQLLEDKKQLRVEQQTADAISRQSRGGGGGRTGNKGKNVAVAGGGTGAISSAIISGAFPLLFGQGLAGGAAGALGGGVGSLVGGQMGGFAGGLLATAVLTQIQEADRFRTEIDRLNVSIRATGGISDITAKQVTQFGKSLGLAKEEALAALNSFKQFGGAARIALNQVFGKENVFDTFANLKNNKSILNALPGLSKELSLDQAKAALQVLKSKNAREAESFLLDGIITKQRTVTKEEAKRLNFFQRQASKLNVFRGKFTKKDPDSAFFGLAAGGSFSTMSEAADLRGEKAEKSFDQKVNEALQLLEIQKEFNRELERQAIIKAPVDELNRLIEPLTQIDALSKSLGNSFADSFKGIVKGSMTAQEALRNLFQRTADHFIDMAAQILAAQVRAGIMGLFSRAFSGGIFSGGGSAGANNIAFGSQNLGINTASNFPGFADGGRPPVGRASIVGERGPELFVPDRAGTIVPNNAMGGSTNIVINVDASGSSVEGDEEQANQFGSAIATAIQSELIKQKRPGGLLA